MAAVMALIDKEQVAKRFQTAQFSYAQQAIAQQKINQRLIELLQTSGRHQFERVLEIGCGTGDLTERLIKAVKITELALNDLYFSDNVRQGLQQNRYANVEQVRFIGGDIEQLTLTQQYDLIISASTVQWLHHKAAFLAKCAQHLNANGMLLFNTFAPNNLTEISTLTGVGLSYPTAAEWQQWLKPYFALEHLSTETIRLRFDSPLTVLRHLKATGVTAVEKTIWTKGKLQQFCQAYQQRYALADGSVYLSYVPMYFVVGKLVLD